MICCFELIAGWYFWEVVSWERTPPDNQIQHWGTFVSIQSIRHGVWNTPIPGVWNQRNKNQKSNTKQNTQQRINIRGKTSKTSKWPGLPPALLSSFPSFLLSHLSFFLLKRSSLYQAVLYTLWSILMFKWWHANPSMLVTCRAGP